jgi:flavodoxin
MNKFLNALEVGVESAQNRELNFLEIHEVFTELKTNIDAFLDGKAVTVFESLTGLGRQDYFKNKTNLFQDKVLSIQENKKRHKLTQVYFSHDNGYPCTITINEDEYTATNKSSLEDNLKTLLSTPSIGTIFYTIQKE